MADDNEPLVEYPDDEQESGLFRWISACIVLLAVAGFFGLAWYAYKSGGEGVNDTDVEEIRADKTPVKEAPADRGGMQIPNQDKTVYGLIGGKNGTDKPTVERILPAPEEPIVHNADGTETWMNEKVRNKAATDKSDNEHVAQVDKALTTPQETVPKAPAQDAKIEAKPEPKPEAPKPEVKKADQFTPPHNADDGDVVAPVTAPPAEKPLPRTVKPDETKPAEKPTVVKLEPAKSIPPTDTETPTEAPLTAAKTAPAAPAVAPPAKEEADDDDKPAPKAATPAATPAKGARAQLGAYKSEAEAKANWAKISKEYSDDVSGKQYYIVRADLGAKGVYYRLQVAPFASPKEAESFCFNLVSGGQGCFLAKAK